ncbi:CDP-diacylglycerol--serine O-phosphatidyltransferase [Gammaproteobacteria bacterium]|nr:CDP-diacylglycerol--serine O-phosphatidyltransferase [Gammaproteobacteria bacterium]
MQKSKIWVKKGLYLVPNFFTTLTLFFGFLSLAYSQKGDINVAVSCVCLAMVSDFMDGLIARLTNTQSEFGQEYDSLADMLAFGVAPASLAWHYAILKGLAQEPFWLITFVYLFAITARLARFNALKQFSDTQFFRGLPSPAAAGLVCSVVLTCFKYDPSLPLELLLTGVLILTSLCVVSNMAYPSLKRSDLLQRRPVLIFALILLLAFVSMVDPLLALLGTLGTYALSGPLISTIHLYFNLPLKKMVFQRWGRVIVGIKKRRRVAKS